MKTKSTLFDSVNEKEMEEKVTQQAPKKAEICSPSTNPNKKKVVIQVRIDQYDQFKRINEKRNVSTNSIWNMMMTDYITQYKDLL